ncbi:unnamed protein product [Diamesa serratosioi]
MFRQLFLFVAVAALAYGNPVPFGEQEISPFIVGGAPANLGQIPWQVSLRTTGNFHFCGASIIADRWVLSAAHCTIGRAQTSVNVVVGTVLLNSGGVVIRSSRIVNHPSYNANTIANDVSVVQTATAMIMNANVRIIPMGSASAGGGLSAQVSGWGGTTTGGSAPNQLQVLTVTTLTNADCRARHSTTNAAFVFDHKICTFTRAGQGICQGDSGGPLWSGGVQIGLVSWNIPCARGWPDAYDRVAWFRSWILQQIA